ncbi:MAG: putative N-formylglutamate amidohydrolase [Polyangiales bacterium]|jgi:predicted N-formylglutamate amidohydrolase
MNAFESLAGVGPIVLTCEHASEFMPSGYAWPDADARLVGTHWAFDPGARDLTLELAEVLRAPAVLSCFSRLLVDPNRPEDSPTLFRHLAEGEKVMLNEDLRDEEKDRRIRELYRPYHGAVDALMRGSGATVAFSVHTFTPLYEGKTRDIEVGILFDEAESDAEVLCQAIADAGWDARLNEPYSGKEGLMYCVDHHATAHGLRPIEIEVRHDLAVDPAKRARLVECIAKSLQGLAATS